MSNQNNRQAQARYNILQIVVVFIFLLLVGRVFYLQFVDTTYQSMSNNNVLRSEIIYPMRGEVYDRNGEYLVQIRGCYDVMVTYRELSKNGFDTMTVCKVLDISPEKLERSLRNARMQSRTPYLVANFVSIENKFLFDELEIPGFHSVYRTVRQYPRKIGGNLLGHVGEINAAQLAANSYYKSGDYIGIGGIESAYETDLRGEKGLRMLMVDNHGVVQGSYMDGLFDDYGKHGATLVSTIDARLQLFGEELLKGKVGSIVAIEPSTGEILMMVSSPTFDPDELVGRERGNNYMDLLNDPRRPLYNRAVTSRYPPGSVFKLVQGVIGLEEGAITPYTRYNCYEGYTYGSKILKCHKHSASTDLEYAVATSCNTYFCHTLNRVLSNKRYEGGINESYTKWRDYVLSFGFGRKLGSDFLSEGQGYVPEASYYDKIYRGSWNGQTVISLSIGQGELGCTPLQMANLAAIIANRGYYYIPHIIRSIDGVMMTDSLKYEPQYTMVSAKNFEPIIEGMWSCVNDPKQGSATLANLKGFDVCGKTGTAQNPHGADHSTFLSFAPRTNPKIAISVYVENGSWGATIAVPIATLIEEMYLTGEVTRDGLVDYVKNLKIDYPNYEK